MSRLHSVLLSGVAVLGTTLAASADSLDRAGSLLVYPLFDNTRAGLFTITVSNTNGDFAPVSSAPSAIASGTVDVEFVYINGYDCLEFNRTRRLTPNDTLTVLTRQDNPNMTEGYVYVFAKSPTTGRAIKWDYLIGDSLIIAPDVLGGVNYAPIVFKGGSALADGAPTDLDNDMVRDLDGVEYEKVSDRLHVPRFISAYPGISAPELILIGLTGSSFTTVVDFLVYNDNEEVFSAQYAFDCWDRVRLAQINGVFTDSFLDSTNNAPLEYLSAIPVALMNQPQQLVPPQIETGWFRMNGSVAYSSAASVQDPAFLAVRTERLVAGVSTAASLPYGIGEQANGDLVAHGPFQN